MFSRKNYFSSGTRSPRASRRIFRADSAMDWALGGMMAICLTARANMIDGGSFDNISLTKPDLGVFEGWSFGPLPDLEGKTRIGSISLSPSGTRPDGGNCVEFHFTEPGEIRMGLWNKIEISPASKYTFSVWAKSTGEPVVILVELTFFSFRESDGARQEHVVPFKFQTSGEWEQKSILIESQSNDELLHVRIHATSRSVEPQTVWIDEASLDPVN